MTFVDGPEPVVLRFSSGSDKRMNGGGDPTLLGHPQTVHAGIEGVDQILRHLASYLPFLFLG